ncbi:hypothetical protein B0T17DRAFT_513724 [Bombardia bombarda]|uniref:ERT1/acuK family PAS domain-containing protein n=1 Tax=Bombardia bombarda TaxID=252184 RepID=A0AA39XIF6_9PEZI|nr:hypothetical protein B0T17DRAFT_513724 [Bombardia bombarda]
MTCDLERPCTRCIKRNIGHLCHDEPRDQDSRKAKSALAPSSTHESESQSDLGRSAMDQPSGSMRLPSFDSASMGNGPGPGPGQVTKPTFEAATLSRSNPLQLVQPTVVSGIQANPLNSNMSQIPGLNTWFTNENHYHDMHNYHIPNEFNLLNDFLHLQSNAFEDSGQAATQGGSMPPPNVEQAKATGKSTNNLSADKTHEYYLQAADPSGNDTPEERMQRVLKAKYEAGLLKPFSYVMGYQRLSVYLSSHVNPISKQKIIRQLDRFRPLFREKMQALTDMDLVIVEMWFEKTLMEYDRVFASMAVPACCWRRTGEIFRGNKEMAELINVPVESLRGGKISLHEILTEESNVRYWEEFGTIAFDPAHDTLLTACSLKNPDDRSNDPVINCCFSFRIRRDDHKIPSLIVGNFLPHDP